VLQAIGTIPSTKVSVSQFVYRGWQDCYLLGNGSIEAIVVPSIGRVMQLRLAGDGRGTFWENRALDGQLHGPVSNDWVNFGGDKCWPAPQSAWKQHQGHDWPPPAAFDSLPMEARACERGVVLASSIDPSYGVQVVRRVELDAALPVMRIRTEYRKVYGNAVPVGVWSITQLRDPERVFVLLGAKPSLAGGYLRQMEAEPAGLRIDGRLLSLARHPHESTKIGTEGRSLLWVGKQCMVRIDAETGPGEYPDGGCVTEVYTSPDPLAYVELETLGPLASIAVGESIERATVYSLMPRLLSDPDADARRVLLQVP
jgi:hypothetical protein